VKDWQKGFELDLLKHYEKAYEHYNSYALSPFGEMKKNTIANLLSLGELLIDFDTDILSSRKTAKASSKIVMHGSTVIGNIQKNDRIIKYVSDPTLISRLSYLPSLSYWLYVWAEDKEANDIALASGFEYVGGKISTYGEIYSIYLKENQSDTDMYGNSVRKVAYDRVEDISLMQLDFAPIPLDIVASLNLNDLPAFQNHYSNYNKKKSWSAIALRGYSQNPLMIEKPLEMNDKWHKEHEGEHFELQNTPFMEHFPQLKEFVKNSDIEFHRIRLMKLTPKGGELTRHTDQVDPESFNTVGGLIRIHYPLITNDKVEFKVWSPRGIKQTVNMKVGECWMLDTRKPHSVYNGGDSDRIHLVVDIKVNDDIYQKLTRRNNGNS